MIDSRRAPSATPGSIWNCSSSGPRWAIAPVIANKRCGGKLALPVKSIAPAIPHIGYTPVADLAVGEAIIRIDQLQVKPP